MKVSLYFRVRGLAVDDNGVPDYAGLILSWTIDKAIEIPPYHELIQQVDKRYVLKTAGLEGNFSEEDIEIMTPEEYELQFGVRSEET